MSTHNICICREIRKILCGYPLLSVAMFTYSYVNPIPYLYQGGNSMLYIKDYTFQKHAYSNIL